MGTDVGEEVRIQSILIRVIRGQNSSGLERLVSLQEAMHFLRQLLAYPFG